MAAFPAGRMIAPKNILFVHWGAGEKIFARIFN